MLKLAETVKCSDLFRLALAHLQWLSRRLLLVEGSAQKSLKLSPRVSFPPRLAHLDQFKPIFETWLTTPAGTSIWMAEPPLSAPAPPCQHNKFQYFRKKRRISWRDCLNRWINVWRGNRRPHKYPNCADYSRLCFIDMGPRSTTGVLGGLGDRSWGLSCDIVPSSADAVMEK